MESHDLVLVLNEVTVLMALSAAGIIALLGMFAHLSFYSIFGKRSQLINQVIDTLQMARALQVFSNQLVCSVHFLN